MEKEKDGSDRSGILYIHDEDEGKREQSGWLLRGSNSGKSRAISNVANRVRLRPKVVYQPGSDFDDSKVFTWDDNGVRAQAHT